MGPIEAGYHGPNLWSLPAVPPGGFSLLFLTPLNTGPRRIKRRVSRVVVLRSGLKAVGDGRFQNLVSICQRSIAVAAPGAFHCSLLTFGNDKGDSFRVSRRVHVSSCHTGPRQARRAWPLGGQGMRDTMFRFYPAGSSGGKRDPGRACPDRARGK